jgi:hypothetical protein
MAAATTTIVALGGLGLSAAQYAQANKKQKEAQKAAEQFTSELKNISRINNYKALGVPTLGYDLAKESQAQSTVASLDALKSMGAEGAGLVPRVQQQNLEQDLALAAKMEQAQNRRDMLVMQEQSAIDLEKTNRDADILTAQATGAQEAAADAQTQKTKAIEGMVGSAVAGLGAINPKGVVNTGGADAMAGLTATDANEFNTNDYTTIPSVDAMEQYSTEDYGLPLEEGQIALPKVTTPNQKMELQQLNNKAELLGLMSWEDYTAKNPKLSFDDALMSYKQLLGLPKIK